MPPEWNAYNMPYHFSPQSPVRAGARRRDGQRRCGCIAQWSKPRDRGGNRSDDHSLGQRLHFEHPYSDSRVKIVNDDARSYMQNAKDRFDLITFSLLDSHTTSSHYSNIRIDNYVYTREALTAAKNLLKPGGIMVLKFQVGKPFIAGRLKATLTEAFGVEPVQFGVDKSFNVSPGTFFVSGDRARIAQAIEEPGLRHHIETHADVPIQPAPITTDDWPFFYQHAPGLPSSVILISLVLAIVCWQLAQRTAVPVSELAWPFFFLGAGFMLMESQIVSRMALLFGTTWLVNSITISGLLLLIVGANILERAGLRIPTPGVYDRPLRDHLDRLFRAGFRPADRIARAQARGRHRRAMQPGVVCQYFVHSHVRGSQLQRLGIGPNLLGALVGGLLESLSMWIGLRALLFLALLLYAAAYFASHRKQRARASSEVEVLQSA